MLHHTTYTKGKDAHWVAFVHGAGGSSSIWYKQIRSFQDRFNILLVDLRGHGESKSPHLTDAKAPYTFEAIAQEVLDVVDHLNIKSAHFVGISLGTIIVREIAELRPDKVRSMILAGAVMKMNVRGKILMRFGVWFKTLVPYLLLYKFFAFIIMPRKQHRESRSLFIREARKLAQKEFIRWFRLAADVNAKLKWFRMKELPIPTLYIMGDQDHMFLPSIRHLVLAHTRTARLAIAPACGHVVNVEQPGYFNQTAIGFLGEIDQAFHRMNLH